MRCRLTIPCVLIALASLPARADDPPAAAVDAPALVRKVREDEHWIQTVKTFRFRAESRWVRTPESVAARTAELKKRFPQAQVDVEHFPELKTESPVQTADVAFDDHRIAVREERPGDAQILKVRIWDGRQARMHEKYQKQERDLYALDKDPFQSVGDAVWSSCVWPEAGRYGFWWVPAN